MINNHNRFINNYSAVERGCFLPVIRSKQAPKSIQNRNQIAYTWPHKQFCTNWRRLNPWMHKWNSCSICAWRRFAVSALMPVPSCCVCIQQMLALRFFCLVTSPFCCVCIPFHCVCIPFRSVAFRGVCVARQYVFVQYFLRLLLSYIAGRNLLFCEHVCVAYVYCLFFVRSSVFRGCVVCFSWICRSFFACPSRVEYLWAVRSTLILHWCLRWAKMEKEILIKGVAFGCTQSGGAPYFLALARTLECGYRPFLKVSAFE